MGQRVGDLHPRIVLVVNRAFDGVIEGPFHLFDRLDQTVGLFCHIILLTVGFVSATRFGAGYALGGNAVVEVSPVDSLQMAIERL